jgi:hypothetical protein
MKVIFLDVDGVLNSEHWYKKNHKRHPERCRVETAIDPRFVRNLKKIVQKTGAKIVLSATCRSTVREKRNHYLHQILEKYGMKIYDYTIRLGNERGYEIQDWLDKHRDVTNIVILDDDSDMVHLSKYLVKTKNSPYIKQEDGSFKRDKSLFAWTKEGLSRKKAKEAIEMLNVPYINIYATKTDFTRKHF